MMQIENMQDVHVHKTSMDYIMAWKKCSCSKLLREQNHCNLEIYLVVQPLNILPNVKWNFMKYSLGYLISILLTQVLWKCKLLSSSLIFLVYSNSSCNVVMALVWCHLLMWCKSMHVLVAYCDVDVLITKFMTFVNIVIVWRSFLVGFNWFSHVQNLKCSNYLCKISPCDWIFFS